MVAVYERRKVYGGRWSKVLGGSSGSCKGPSLVHWNVTTCQTLTRCVLGLSGGRVGGWMDVNCYCSSTGCPHGVAVLTKWDELAVVKSETLLMWVVVCSSGIVSHLPSMNRHLIVVEGFACPRDPRSHGVWASLPLLGCPVTTWSWVKGQTKCGSRRPASLETGSRGPSTPTQVRAGRLSWTWWCVFIWLPLVCSGCLGQSHLGVDECAVVS